MGHIEQMENVPEPYKVFEPKILFSLPYIDALLVFANPFSQYLSYIDNINCSSL